jgi:uncharacterized protein DUF932
LTLVRQNRCARALHQQHHAVVREDTGDVLGIHRRTYRLVPNREVFEPFEETLLRSGVPIEGLAYRGRTVVREYIFPHVAFEPQIGDVVEFKLLVVNSYDATNAFRAVMAGRRRLCLNGVGEERKAHARHTSGFSSERAIDGIRRAMDRYFALDGEWKRWAAREITPETAREVFEAMPEANPRRLARLDEAWAVEAQLAGQTVWGLYNALTRWSTHAPVRAASEANRAAVVLNRESLVRRALAGPRSSGSPGSGVRFLPACGGQIHPSGHSFPGGLFSGPRRDLEKRPKVSCGFVPWRLRSQSHPCWPERQHPCHRAPAFSGGRPQGRGRHSSTATHRGVTHPRGCGAPRS